MAKTATLNLLRHHPLLNPIHAFSAVRSLSLCSSKKDPDLESALTRNRRWIVNNQIKNLLLRSPDQTSTVRSLQKRFRTLDLQGNALNWLRKYPCCFETFINGGDGEQSFRLTKRMLELVEAEEATRESRQPILVDVLSKLLMMSRHRRIGASKFASLKRGFGFPDDYPVSVIARHPERFRIINYGGRRSTMEIELVKLDENLAVPSPPSVVTDPAEVESRAVAVVREILSMTLWKKASIAKLGRFRREFGFPERLDSLLVRHPSVFYVSNRYRIHTVVLREGYIGSELVEKDPLVVVKERFGELMEGGLHEYNQRRCAKNLEEKRRKGLVKKRIDGGEEGRGGGSEGCGGGEKGRKGGIYDAEARRRFYKVLFEDDAH
ncbi:hypothetical protein QJS10_CPA08g01326 [Acorus calamus]|uniref:PORR domain-containing protein n=1 Tax=Acorus calamus TaxID=4465 RepID=A0AAV9EA36_ACOCL|nr:hypothetical protein QJS10_CPA08g01326 [Acorus calamus]